MVDAPDPTLTSVNVLPAYGSGTFVIQWSLQAADVSKFGVNVYRAADGADYELINDHPVITGFVVDTLRPKTKHETVSYRFVAENLTTGEMKYLAQTGIYDQLMPAQHVIGRRFVAQEFHALRRTGGLVCWILPGVGNRSPSATLDLCRAAAAGGRDMPDADAAQVWQTWIKLLGESKTEARREDGTSKDVVTEVSARLPAWPTPKMGSLVVMPSSDDRYVVGEKIQPYKYHSVVPFAYEVPLVLLGRDDPRYRINMPALDPALARPTILPLA